MKRKLLSAVCLLYFLFVQNTWSQRTASMSDPDRISALLQDCDRLRNGAPAKGAAPGANYKDLQRVALQGLTLTPGTDAPDRARFAYFAGLGYYYQVKFDSAQYYFYTSLHAAEKTHSALLITNACAALIPVNYQLQEEARTDSCKSILQSVLDTCRDESVLQDGYSALGSYYRQRSYYTTAQDYILRSLAIRKKQVDTTTSKKLKGDYAIQCYLLFKVYQDADQVDKSLGILNEGRPYMDVSPLLAIRYLSSLVEVYTLTGQIDSSLYYDKLLEQRTANSPTVPSETVSADLNIAQYYIKQHQYGQALPYVTKANTLAERSKSPLLLYQAHMMDGRYAEETGNYGRAIASLEQAIPAARQFSKEQYKDILQFMALAQQGAGNAGEALSFYKQYAAQLDTLTKEKSSRNFADQEIRYETHAKELRITALDKDNRLKAMALQSGRQMRMLLIGGLIILGLFALTLFFLYRKLAVTNDQLILANDTKARLFGIIGHDLRAPVSRIVTLLQLQKARPDILDVDARQRHEERLRLASENVLETMEDLLLWSKSQMEHFTPQPVQVDLNAVLEKEINSLRQSMEDKGIRLDNLVPASMVRITDENFLSVIFRNLLQNAVKYTAAGGIITVAADEGHIYISNPGADTGAEELNLRIQNKQVDSKGSGLGLQIAAGLAAAIHARISFKQDKAWLTAVLSW
ncbi:MAG TPA: tetratricopeptide repeat-containing sensor histidine kinase [Puia sp.]|nr:tetratricopeptide repeat-containing sensor histidine kinase [Puia sp.]